MSCIKCGNYTHSCHCSQTLYYHNSDYTKVHSVHRNDVRPTTANGVDKWDYVYVKRGNTDMLVRTFPDFESCAQECLGRITFQLNEYARRYAAKKQQLERLKKNLAKGA